MFKMKRLKDFRQWNQNNVHEAYERAEEYAEHYRGHNRSEIIGKTRKDRKIVRKTLKGGFF